MLNAIFLNSSNDRYRSKSGRAAVQRYYFSPSLKLLKIIRPSLHHDTALFNELRSIVSGPQRTRNAVRQLMLDYFWRKA